MYRKLIPLFLIFILTGCSAGKVEYGSSYKSLEHGGEHKHTPQELYKECLQIKKEINVLKVKADTVKGPGYELPRKQIQTDIEWLTKKYNEADCDKVVSTSQPATSEEKPVEVQPAAHEHKADEAQPAVKDGKPDGSLSFDECFKKCKELTSRTNEECFDACLHH